MNNLTNGPTTMKEYKTMAHIHSLKGEMAEITLLDKVGDNDYIVDYKTSYEKSSEKRW